MGKMSQRWRKKSLYKKSVIIFSVLLLLVSILFLLYVFTTLIQYENAQINNHIKNLVTSGELAKNIEIKDFEKNKYETSKKDPESGLKELLKNSEIDIKKSSEKENTYNLYIDDAYIAAVSLEKVASYPKMLILTIDEWEVSEIEASFDRGIYYYDIVIPSDYKLSINGKTVDDSYEQKDVEELDKLTAYVEINKTNYYKLDNFISKPKIEIRDENNKVIDYKIKNNKIEIQKEFKTYDTYEEAKKHLNGEIDIMKLAEDWSLFLTDDLHGEWHGFTKLTPYLIKDNNMYQMAYNWSHNIDITFVSNHTLKNPVFTNESVKNCTVYNENAFNCEVYLEKNMKVNGEDRVDTSHDYLYFVNYEGGWKLVDMKSI